MNISNLPRTTIFKGQTLLYTRVWKHTGNYCLDIYTWTGYILAQFINWLIFPCCYAWLCTLLYICHQIASNVQMGYWSNVDWPPSGYGWIMVQGQFRCSWYSPTVGSWIFSTSKLFTHKPRGESYKCSLYYNNSITKPYHCWIPAIKQNPQSYYLNDSHAFAV